jgi:hypothetical protein
MSNEFSHLPPKPGQMQINQKQGSLALEIDKQTEIQGIGMGVLKDGTPFLNQRGLARLCGIENAHIGTISSQWNETEQKPRIRAIKDLLFSRGITVDSPPPCPDRRGEANVCLPGRRPNVASVVLAQKLGDLFRRYNSKITRHSLDSARADNRPYQIDGGPFFEFAEAVLKPLQVYLRANRLTGDQQHRAPDRFGTTAPERFP